MRTLIITLSIAAILFAGPAVQAAATGVLLVALLTPGSRPVRRYTSLNEIDW